jgi:hypothetical protein
MGRQLATEVRGGRVAVIRKNVRHHALGQLLLPLLHTPGSALGPAPGAGVPVGGWAWVQEGGASPRQDGGGDGAGAGAGGPRAGVMAGHQG